MNDEILKALKTLLTPLIKEVVLTTIEEYQSTPQQTETVEEATVKPNEAAKQLNVSISTLWRWEKEGYLKPIRIGTKVYYRQHDIDVLKQGRRAIE